MHTPALGTANCQSQLQPTFCHGNEPCKVQHMHEVYSSMIHATGHTFKGTSLG
jgi:hypothetical protein